MLRKIDCVMVRVEDVEVAAEYYARVFGLRRLWSNDGSVGLVFAESDAEIVLHSSDDLPSPVEVHYLVDDVAAAVAEYTANGCNVLVASFEITIGKCAVVQDPVRGAPLHPRHEHGRTDASVSQTKSGLSGELDSPLLNFLL